MSDSDFEETLSDFLSKNKTSKSPEKTMEKAGVSPLRRSSRSKEIIKSNAVVCVKEKKAIVKYKSVKKDVACKRKGDVVLHQRDIKRKRLGSDNLNKSDSMQKFDLLIDPKERFVGKVGNASSNSVIKNIKLKLNDDQLSILKNSRFGSFLWLDKDVLSLRLIHSILLREVHHANLSELWFNYGSQILRFSLYEFGLVSGLVCGSDESRFSGYFEDGDFFNKFFSDESKITRQVIEAKFLDAVWENDDEAVKFAKLYMVQCFILGNLGTTLIEDRFIHLLDSSDYDDFPWGKYSFELFVQSTKNKLSSKLKSSSQSTFYRLYGFPYAIQFWFYETLVSVPQYLCTLNDAAAYPRLMRWIPKDIKKMQNFDFKVFDDETEKVTVLSNIVATDDESGSLIVNGLYYQGHVAAQERNDACIAEVRIMEVARSACVNFVKELKAQIFDNDVDYSDLESDVRKRICASVDNFEVNQLSNIFKVNSGKAETVEKKIHNSVDSEDVDYETDNEKNIGSSEETANDDSVSYEVLRRSADVQQNVQPNDLDNSKNDEPVGECVDGEMVYFFIC
ncbi:uncharacterized protein LOC126674039 [Mercurialis annua]|uniref:uncharacterized protein LOC126674039 n=1 Tax=Mercurialis annua TaxID=3986 RepID=UPI0021600D3C|nr:uncharacterized protein LOC126674039 [Mercurialis annua]